MVLGGSGRTVGVDWGRLLVGQLEFYWDVHYRATGATTRDSRVVPRP